uniref:NADH dehydrogenase subunit 5 n=1 Tax=Aleurodicus dispersus TaxID=267823 RepID=U5IIP1_9HEMI|nr:NADH dehydrogenase subunit 5 [Aleurodicus dispersus]ALD62467.1 NADH dehydrogenase subunit 5 [Aleurodicus dispersus]
MYFSMKIMIMMLMIMIINFMFNILKFSFDIFFIILMFKLIMNSLISFSEFLKFIIHKMYLVFFKFIEKFLMNIMSFIIMMILLFLKLWFLFFLMNTMYINIKLMIIKMMGIIFIFKFKLKIKLLGISIQFIMFPIVMAKNSMMDFLIFCWIVSLLKIMVFLFFFTLMNIIILNVYNMVINMHFMKIINMIMLILLIIIISMISSLEYNPDKLGIPHNDKLAMLNLMLLKFMLLLLFPMNLMFWWLWMLMKDLAHKKIKDLNMAWVIKWKNAKLKKLIEIEMNMILICLNVDNAMIFLMSHSMMEFILAMNNVIILMMKIMFLISAISLIEFWNRIISKTPAVTSVEEWTSAEMGVGAAMASVSHEENGIWALFEKAAIMIKKMMMLLNLLLMNDQELKFIIMVILMIIMASPIRLFMMVEILIISDFLFWYNMIKMNEITPNPSHPMIIEIMLDLWMTIIMKKMNNMMSLKNMFFFLLWFMLKYLYIMMDLEMIKMEDEKIKEYYSMMMLMYIDDDKIFIMFHSMMIFKLNLLNIKDMIIMIILILIIKMELILFM